jgi:hypothetical protein
LAAGDEALTITAAAQTPADLTRLEQVVGSHLERFGSRDGLQVAFARLP